MDARRGVKPCPPPRDGLGGVWVKGKVLENRRLSREGGLVYEVPQKTDWGMGDGGHVTWK